MSLFAWVDSFTLLALSYGETVKKITGTRQVKINRTVCKQITDEEKLIISTINPTYSSVVLNTAKYVFADLFKLLAQNAPSFTKKYVSSKHSQIGLYLQTRALKYKRTVDSITQGTQPKGKGKPIKKQKMLNGGQRAWV
jgi:hypothetical protein